MQLLANTENGYEFVKPHAANHRISAQYCAMAKTTIPTGFIPNDLQQTSHELKII